MSVTHLENSSGRATFPSRRPVRGLATMATIAMCMWLGAPRAAAQPEPEDDDGVEVVVPPGDEAWEPDTDFGEGAAGEGEGAGSGEGDAEDVPSPPDEPGQADVEPPPPDGGEPADDGDEEEAADDDAPAFYGSITGAYRFRLNVMSDIPLNPVESRMIPGELGQNLWAEQWFRFTGEIGFRPKLRLIGQIDLADGVLFGDSTEGVTRAEQPRDDESAFGADGVQPRWAYLE